MSDHPQIQLTVDRSQCMGSGRCVADAAHLFGLDAEHKAVLLQGDASGLSEDAARDIVEGCPGGAIIATVDGVEIS